MIQLSIMQSRSKGVSMLMNSAEGKSRSRVLIVDPQEVVQQGLASVFGSADGFELVSAYTYGDAVQIVHDNKLELVIMDLELPGRGGIDLIKEIYSIRRDLPIIVYTMHDEIEYGLRAIKCGAWGFVKKSDSLVNLREAVSQTMSGRRYVTPELAQSLMSFIRKDTDRPPHEMLSDREFQVLCALARGQQIKHIAAELFLSVKTVSTYRARILQKLELKGLADIVKYCLDHKLF